MPRHFIFCLCWLAGLVVTTRAADADVEIARARELAGAGKLDEATRAFDDILSTETNRAEIFFWRGEVLARRSRHAAAIKDFTMAGGLKPDWDGPPMRRAVSHLALGDRDAAFKDFSTALRVNPNLAEAWYERGNIHYLRWNLSAALDDYAQAIRLRPNYREVRLQRGWVYYWSNQPEKALEDFSENVRLNPKNAQVRYARGMARNALGKYEEAIEDYSAALRLAPNYQGPLNHRGEAYMTLGQFEKAVSDFTAAIASRPDDPLPYGNRAWCHFSLHQPARAIRDYDKALRMQPTNVWWHIHRGRVHVTATNHDLALKDFAWAMKNAPTLAEPYLYRGIVHAGARRFDQAAADYSQAIALNMKLPEVHEGRLFANFTRGQAEHVSEDVGAWLKAKGWKDAQAPFIAIIGSLLHREGGNDAAARRLLDDAMTKSDAAKWPRPILRYLRGEFSSDELLKLATDNDKETEARAYMGLDLLLKGRREDARTQLRWVQEHGNRDFTEHVAATERLARMEAAR